MTGSVGDPVEMIEQRTGRRGSQHRPVIPDPRPHRALADTLVLSKRGSHPRRRPAGAPPLPGRSRPPALLHTGHIHHPRRPWGQHKILDHHPVLPPTLQQLTFQQQRRRGPSLVSTSSPTTGDPARSAAPTRARTPVSGPRTPRTAVHTGNTVTPPA